MHHDATHDLDLIAGLAADDLDPADHARAQALIGSCGDCRSLHDDLLAIARATRALPAAPAPRDFRITLEQAARLRRTGWVARLLGPIAGARSIARPIAATFTTLGLVGVLVSAAMPGLLGGGASLGAPTSAGAGVVTAAPGAQVAPDLASAAPVDPGFGAKDNAAGSEQPAYIQAGDGSEGSTTDTRDALRVSDAQPASLLLWGSVTVLGLGLMLFALRFAGRRLH